MCLSVAKKIIEALPWLQLEPEEVAPLSQIINPMHEGDPKAAAAAAVVAAAAAESEAAQSELFDLPQEADGSGSCSKGDQALVRVMDGSVQSNVKHHRAKQSKAKHRKAKQCEAM